MKTIIPVNDLLYCEGQINCERYRIADAAVNRVDYICLLNENCIVCYRYITRLHIEFTGRYRLSKTADIQTGLDGFLCSNYFVCIFGISVQIRYRCSKAAYFPLCYSSSICRIGDGNVIVELYGFRCAGCPLKF